MLATSVSSGNLSISSQVISISYSCLVPSAIVLSPVGPTTEHFIFVDSPDTCIPFESNAAGIVPSLTTSTLYITLSPGAIVVSNFPVKFPESRVNFASLYTALFCTTCAEFSTKWTS